MTITAPTAASCTSSLRGVRSALRAAVGVRRARRLLTPGRAVVLDTETTDIDGVMCEIAISDTAGTVLLDTLINPGIPITAAATAVHGITDHAVANAPTAAEVLPRIVQLIGHRQVLAYNAPFDRAVLVRDAHRTGTDLAGLAVPQRWSCVMRLRATVECGPWRALDGGHRALSDTHATLAVLHALAHPLRSARR